MKVIEELKKEINLIKTAHQKFGVTTSGIGDCERLLLPVIEKLLEQRQTMLQSTAYDEHDTTKELDAELLAILNGDNLRRKGE